MRDLQLRYWPDNCLRNKCVEQDISGALEVGNEMLQIMQAHNGYGLSAPQVGLNCRIFVMYIPDKKGMIFVNPEIIKLGSIKVKEWEGCLSLLSMKVMIERYTQIEIEYTDPQFPSLRINWEAKGLDARCIQHEMDHLNGILIFDHIKGNLAQKLFLEKYAKKKARI